MTHPIRPNTLRTALALLAALALFASMGTAQAQPKKGGTQSGYQDSDVAKAH